MVETIDPELQTLEFGKFSGINNVADSLDLKPEELVSAKNIDLDGRGMVSQRGGFVKKVTNVPHSLWSNEKRCYYVEAGVLKELATDYTSTTIRTDVSDYHTDFVEINEIVYYTNSNVNGFITADGVDNVYVDPGIDHKFAPEPSQLIEYFNSRLFFAKNQTIWYSDAGAFRRIDKRRNFIQTPNSLTMMRAVDDGIWVSYGDIDTGEIVFLSGRNPDKFSWTPIVDARGMRYGVIEGAVIKVSDIKAVFPDLGIQGSAIIFSTRHGICVGGNGGVFINLTVDKYKLTDNRFGAGLLRFENNKFHYIATFWS